MQMYHSTIYRQSTPTHLHRSKTSSSLLYKLASIAVREQVMKEPLHVIHIEDISADSELVAHMLRENGYDCRFQRVETRAQLLNALEHSPCDLILSDCTLPQYSGLEALREAHARKPHIPFIFVSGTIGEEVAIRSLQQGATDYVLKHRLSRLAPAVRRALSEAEARKLHQAMQEQLRQARKLEAIGLLAGGLAHDFRNVLQILRLSLTLLPMKADEPEEVTKLAAQMEKTVDRGCDMIKELLAFARKSESRLVKVDAANEIKDTVNMVRASLPANVDLHMDLKEKLPAIDADPGQFDRILTNLIVNARDAMPDGGNLTISTEITHVDSMLLGQHTDKKLSYVRVTVTDTGMGMDETTRSRIFEPFFTTKSVGKGTGLGLSVVCGLMDNHHGFIDVHSEVGKGTSIALFFPVPQESMLAQEEMLREESLRLLGTSPADLRQPNATS